jgi:hypothetical protein
LKIILMEEIQNSTPNLNKYSIGFAIGLIDRIAGFRWSIDSEECSENIRHYPSIFLLASPDEIKLKIKLAKRKVLAPDRGRMYR